MDGKSFFGTGGNLARQINWSLNSATPYPVGRNPDHITKINK